MTVAVGSGQYEMIFCLRPLTSNVFLLEPFSDLQSPGDHPVVLVGISSFKVF